MLTGSELAAEICLKLHKILEMNFQRENIVSHNGCINRNEKFNARSLHGSCGTEILGSFYRGHLLHIAPHRIPFTGCSVHNHQFPGRIDG